MTNLSSSVVNSLYNLQLMKVAGENGVAAYGSIMYANFIFIAIFIGYSIGSAPIVSYHYGAGNHSELKNMFKKEPATDWNMGDWTFRVLSGDYNTACKIVCGI